MDSHLMENAEEPLSETPEDVAILYSWANLHGAKYRDFSASRREYRAQVRHRAAEDLRESELAAKAHAEAAATDAERMAREAERAARSAENYDSAADREHALRTAEDAARRAGAERVEAARRAESAAIAEAAARREEREIAEAHASAQRQAKSYTYSEVRRRTLAGPQPTQPGLASDPYGYVHLDAPPMQRNMPQAAMPQGGEQIPPTRYRNDFDRRVTNEGRASGDRRSYQPELEVRRRPQGYRPDETSGIHPAYRPQTAADAAGQGNRYDIPQTDFGRGGPAYGDRSQGQYGSQGAPTADLYAPRYQEPYPPLRGEMRGEVRGENRGWQPPAPAPVQEQPGPAWLYASNPAPRTGAQRVPVADSLQHQRERVASQWFALKGAFEPGRDMTAQADGPQEIQTPVLGVFSLAGGVGKTSLVATLGRALSSLGEKVLLADTTSHGLLPYYFGASELRPGVVRTFSPPSGSADAPIHLVSYDVEQSSHDGAKQAALLQQMGSGAQGTHRVVLDLNASSGWLIRRLAQMKPTILVPVAPDMNSVISLQSAERFFEGVVDRENRTILPYYVLNQFDASLPLHLDVREVLRRQLGDRLLPFVVRRAPAVSEALAEGMTVVDYAPDAAIAEDYMNVAGWLRSLSPPATQGLRTNRWSER